MKNIVSGGQTTYGHLVGILMSDSTIPRIPGDPGHAGTFPFPVVYEVLKGFPFEDLVNRKKDHIDILIEQAKALEKKGVSLIVTDCGLFGPFQEALRHHLDVPFIGSALDMIPLLQRFLPVNQQVGIITGDTRILTAGHLKASGIDPETVLIAGMENSSEFNRVVIERQQTLDVEKMRKGAVDAALSLSGKGLGAIVLECTNLISFRRDIQNKLNVPVFDLVTMIDTFISSIRPRNFHSPSMQ
ncbi:aspartate/glutamate racemase family protein [Desulfobacula sp.]|uniref:aspartate/glutamate racemase family protein n=1 Tax=Desulfobacula sp. TaxID=2593537 RepID=UPI00260FCEB3|nr:aspartate/glutamate racemase family protein [Desulfobacula sp.]